MNPKEIAKATAKETIEQFRKDKRRDKYFVTDNRRDQLTDKVIEGTDAGDVFSRGEADVLIDLQAENIRQLLNHELDQIGDRHSEETVDHITEIVNGTIDHVISVDIHE